MTSIPASLPLLIFAALFAGWLTVTLVLKHHWDRYELDKDNVRRAKMIHFSVSVLLFIFLIFALIKTI